MISIRNNLKTILKQCFYYTLLTVSIYFIFLNENNLSHFETFIDLFFTSLIGFACGIISSIFLVKNKSKLKK